ncbi:helix-turn-helix domain-containing protein [Corynebacterium terpenotabidum]|uniref:HTH3 DNA-binding transcription regulator n=1 Tax=Corynebacterium terpenotabidum Y-11 TaxID=1200352 RepID=S4XCX1_9CORY|nr:helix-turn-helix transcriptional regulator [Corynebacterium terpenotabidum]AGP30947.1 HTH3 DNA-binding transcription regulator [Corynebacterium terpenotabidum Y-11]
MANHTTLLEHRHPSLRTSAPVHDVPVRPAATSSGTAAALPTDPVAPSVSEPLLREALGLTLRSFREDSRRTLRELAVAANVSPGYLSELERGRKEVSSELLASICHALGVHVSTVILEAAEMMAFDVAAAELAAGMEKTPTRSAH